MRAATVVQVLQDLFYCMFYFICDRSLTRGGSNNIKRNTNDNVYYTVIIAKRLR